MLISFVALYLLFSIALGIFAATKVHNSKDYITAGRQLPIYMVIAMVFATWFGAETVLGIPGTFVDENLGGLISDPFGASFCLIFFALFFAKALYRKNLLTIGDFYRDRFSQKVEVAVGIAIAISYLGWVSAQVTALGLVIHVLTQELVSMNAGIGIGAAIVLIYTLFGGMWSVAITTFVQMLVIVVGLVWIGFLVSDMTQGVAPVIEHAAAAGKFEFWPELSWPAVITFIAGFLTMALGSIPQQDVFQRANASKNESIAVWGTLLGGVAYFFFAAVPLYLAYSAFIIAPDVSAQLSAKDPQLVLPSMILNHLPVYAQIIFFGALLSVIMSTASGTLLAPAVTLSENVIKPLLPQRLKDTEFLWLTRGTVALFAILVAVYALWSQTQATSIHHMVENAYKVTLVMALVPLVAGIYCSKANNNGAIMAIALGVVVWIPMEFIAPEGPVPPHFYGFIAAIVGMVIGSLFKQEKSILMAD
ncbi:sodium:solute symporter family protein [Pleionea sediminis]|uniref:sodium:solute symporter family protein n=1 Tax=Pleionea sediminis TaxID=2569479 RepID=UPI0011853CAA|nr:sodium:solute symporter family protein [Pleionea sediminis]